MTMVKSFAEHRLQSSLEVFWPGDCRVQSAGCTKKINSFLFKKTLAPFELYCEITYKSKLLSFEVKSYQLK